MLKNYFPSIKKEVVLFILICSFSLFFRLKIIHELPLGVAYTEYGLEGFDDEPAHLNYTKYVLQYHSLPVFTSSITDNDAFEKNEFEYHQPPLYYLSVSALSSLFNITSERGQLLVGRYFNLIIAIFSIFIAYQVFLKLGWQSYQSLTACSFILLLGSHVYHTSLFSNDALSWLIIWYILYLLLTGGLKRWIQIILLLSIGHYTKSNILVIYPVLIWSVIYSNLNKKNVNKNAVAVVLIPLIVAIPWYYRNYMLYDSLLNLSGSDWHFVANYFESMTRIIHAPYSILFKMYFIPAKSFISVFNIFQYITIFPLIAAGIWKLSKKIKTDYNSQVVLLMLLAMLIAYMWVALPTGFTEGRMLFPALPLMIYLLFLHPVMWEEKFKLKEYFIMLLVCLFTMPQFIIGFYF